MKCKIPNFHAEPAGLCEVSSRDRCPDTYDLLGSGETRQNELHKVVLPKRVVLLIKGYCVYPRLFYPRLVNKTRS